jgi:hypothetical protein
MALDPSSDRMGFSATLSAMLGATITEDKKAKNNVLFLIAYQKVKKMFPKCKQLSLTMAMGWRNGFLTLAFVLQE